MPHNVWDVQHRSMCANSANSTPPSAAPCICFCHRSIPWCLPCMPMRAMCHLLSSGSSCVAARPHLSHVIINCQEVGCRRTTLSAPLTTEATNTMADQLAVCGTCCWVKLAAPLQMLSRSAEIAANILLLYTPIASDNAVSYDRNSNDKLSQSDNVSNCTACSKAGVTAGILMLSALLYL